MFESRIIDWSAGTAMAILAILYVVKIIYRLHFHPLRYFPGRTAAKITNLYEFYHNGYRGGKYLEEIVKAHQEFGPVIRISPNRPHFSDPEVYTFIYTSRPILVKDPSFYAAFGIPNGMGGTSDLTWH
ncbi:hypothetical protein BDD12DRAFT_874121 [Trichophaea hybrida]|nr:hypothetical protein BDD12DRAFT_874121 [Trichophaea hybrida]